jgi:hypothetical protein
MMSLGAKQTIQSMHHEWQGDSDAGVTLCLGGRSSFSSSSKCATVRLSSDSNDSFVRSASRRSMARKRPINYTQKTHEYLPTPPYPTPGSRGIDWVKVRSAKRSSAGSAGNKERDVWQTALHSGVGPTCMFVVHLLVGGAEHLLGEREGQLVVCHGLSKN